MTKITLTEQQASLLVGANGGDIVLVNAEGKRLGIVQQPLFTDEEVSEAERRANSGGPWYSTEQVLAHLRSLAPE